MTDLSRFIQRNDDTNAQGRYVYRFPNGAVASVIPDPRRPLRWEIATEGNTRIEAGLTSDETELRLIEVANAPTTARG